MDVKQMDGEQRQAFLALEREINRICDLNEEKAGRVLPDARPAPGQRHRTRRRHQRPPGRSRHGCLTGNWTGLRNAPYSRIYTATTQSSRSNRSLARPVGNHRKFAEFAPTVAARRASIAGSGPTPRGIQFALTRPGQQSGPLLMPARAINRICAHNKTI